MKERRIFYEVFRPIITFYMKVILNLKIENKEYIPKEGKIILCGNHRAYFDPLCVCVSTKRFIHSLCWYTYYYKFEWFFKNVGCIPVIKGVSWYCLEKAIDYLNEGSCINLFPEGKMNKTDELLPFRRGAVVMAQETGSKIVPYCLVGKYKFRSKDLKIVFGEPIDVSKMSFEEGNQLLWNSVNKLLIENRKG